MNAQQILEQAVVTKTAQLQQTISELREAMRRPTKPRKPRAERFPVEDASRPGSQSS